MSPEIELVVLVMAALCAGTVDAIAGGGGLVTVPALLAIGLPPHAALATNKGQSVFGSAAALATFWRAGKVTRELAAPAFALALAGSLGGAITLTAIAPQHLRPVVIVLLLCAAGLMLVRKPQRAPGELTRRRFGWALVIAAVIGFYDGFFGPGTGTFVIIGMVLLCGADLPRATADAKVVNLASNLAALAWFSAHGTVVWRFALPMAAAQLCGGIIGARLAIRGGAQVIRLAVVLVSLALVGKLGYDLIASN